MRNLYVRLVLVSGISAACAAPAPEAKVATVAAPERAPVVLRFNWPVPSSAWVTEKVLKKGNTATIRYRVDATKADEGNIELRYHDLTFMSLNGQKVDTLGESEQLRELEAKFMSAMPTIIISSAGDFLGIGDLEQLIDTVLKLKNFDSPEKRESVRTAMQAPQMQALLTQKLAQNWLGWGRLWTGRPMLEGKKVVEQDESGRSVYSITNTTPDSVTVFFEHKADPEKLVEETRALLKSMANNAGADANESDKELEDLHAEKTVIFTATLNRDTLQPLTASRLEASKIRAQARKEEQRETHNYIFEWD